MSHLFDLTCTDTDTVSDLADFLLDTSWLGSEEIELFSCELVEICESAAQLLEAASC